MKRKPLLAIDVIRLFNLGPRPRALIRIKTKNGKMVIVNAWQSGIGRNMLTISGNLGKPPTDLEVGWATILLAF